MPRKLPAFFTLLIVLPVIGAACVAMELDDEGSSPPRAATEVPQAEASEPTGEATETASGPLATPTPAPSGRVTLNAVGDIMLARSLVILMDEYGSAYPYEAVRHLLEDADITIGNLEGTFTDGGVQANKYYTFRTPPRHAIGLVEAGFDIVSLGNNHAMDFGEAGLVDTIEVLEAVGLRHSGAGLDAAAARRPAILEANGLRIAFLSYNAAALSEAFPAGTSRPGVALAEVGAIQQDVAGVLPDVDLVVVSLHAGTEYVDAPTWEQVTLSRAAIDAGATLVLGHHPHVLQGWERYGDGYIFYSLGNFVFDLYPEDIDWLGLRPFQTYILHLELTREGVEDFELRPVYIDPWPRRPVPATGEQRAAIEARIRMLNDLVP